MQPATSATGPKPDDIATRLASIRAVEGNRRDSRPPVPTSAKIELVAGCAVGCCFCAATHRGRPRQLMTWDCYIEVASCMKQAGVTQLGLFYMGESMEHPRLADAIRHAKEALGFPYVFLTANALAATSTRVEQCMAAGLDSLKLSVHFAGDADVARMTGMPAHAFDRQLEHVAAARRIRDAVAVSTGHRCALYASTLDMGSPHTPGMRAVLDAVVPLVDSHYWLPLLGPAAGGRVKDKPCWTLFNEAHVRVDGTLSACPLDGADRFAMGNQRGTSFMDAWHSPDFSRLRQAHLDGDLSGTVCSRCLSYRVSDESTSDQSASEPSLPAGPGRSPALSGGTR